MGQETEAGRGAGQVFTARASGATPRQAAAAAGVSRTAGHYWLAQPGGARPRSTSTAAGVAVVTGGARGDLTWVGAQKDADRDRWRAGSFGIDGVAGGRSQRRTERLPRRSSGPAGHHPHRPATSGKLADDPMLRSYQEDTSWKNRFAASCRR